MPGYVLSPQARADMVGIWACSVERWGESQADRYIRLIDGIFEKGGRR